MASATENLGPHLLGRVHIPDERDYPLSAFLAPLAPNITDWLATSKEKDVIQAWRMIHHHTPPAPNPPPPRPSAVLWGDLIQLDQGQTSHCVGFGWAGWGDAAPIEDTYQNADGDAIYYQCKVIDGEPNQEDGSSVRSGAKVMKARGRLNAYAFAASLDEVKAWITQHGPLVIGSDWTEAMFAPNPEGFVTPTGSVAGGHCYLLLGYDPRSDVLTFRNSWGSGWGIEGEFKMHAKDFEALVFGGNGECCAAVELP